MEGIVVLTNHLHSAYKSDRHRQQTDRVNYLLQPQVSTLTVWT